MAKKINPVEGMTEVRYYTLGSIRNPAQWKQEAIARGEKHIETRTGIRYLLQDQLLRGKVNCDPTLKGGMSPMIPHFLTDAPDNTMVVAGIREDEYPILLPTLSPEAYQELDNGVQIQLANGQVVRIFKDGAMEVSPAEKTWAEFVSEVRMQRQALKNARLAAEAE